MWPSAGILRRHPIAQTGQCVGADALQRLVAVVVTASTGPEGEGDRSVGVDGVDRCRLRMYRPDIHAVERDLVVECGVLRQAGQRDQRIVVTVNSPGLGLACHTDVCANPDRARCIELEPETRVVRTDVANQRTQLEG